MRCHMCSMSRTHDADVATHFCLPRQRPAERVPFIWLERCNRATQYAWGPVGFSGSASFAALQPWYWLDLHAI